jgi:hypothetical protein
VVGEADASMFLAKADTLALTFIVGGGSRVLSRSRTEIISEDVSDDERERMESTDRDAAWSKDTLSCRFLGETGGRCCGESVAGRETSAEDVLGRVAFTCRDLGVSSCCELADTVRSRS